MTLELLTVTKMDSVCIVSTMAVWRKKACELFGFPANEHSYARGKVELFADLLQLVVNSEDDPLALDRIAEYITWATAQNSDELALAVDLAFLLPMFRDERIHDLLRDRLAPEMMASKRAMLMDDTASGAQ